MNLRDLEYLVAVAEHLHFSKAAEACHTSQPTLSMQIKKLEEYLDVTLFERAHKQIFITPAGQAISERAKVILQSVKEIRAIAGNARDPLSGDFSLGLFPTLAPYLLPLCVPYIHASLPKLKLFLREEKTGKLLQLLLEGKLDCALLALPAEHDKLITEPLFEDPFLLAVPTSHPLAKRREVGMEDIAGEPLLLLEEGHCLRAQALELCNITGAREYQEFRATSLETLRHMVAAGAGITLIPKLAAHASSGITYIPFSDKKIARTIGLVWRKQTARGEAIGKVKNAVLKGMNNRQPRITQL